ncbi:MAG: UDP-N-acetylmuramoyl-L-alanyl-D-glutamate--2,6-diaminopimelate ligase [Firmicutes bacterium]|nr:UDP-N-acetylmuramoyl-L-alanyl-D-glutamate--2,6-diaminopimelate ligase [Bacillota bacterium]
MLLSEIANTLDAVYLTQTEDILIENISFLSSKKLKNALYFCLKGNSVDGHNYVNEAIKNGAVAIVCEKKIIGIDEKILQLLVPDTRSALAFASAKLYNYPHKKLKMIGITGTNGKTTTSYILHSILTEANINTGIIGTNGAVFNDKKLELNLTTPDPPELFCILDQMVKSGVKAVVMEVSAHALALNKTSGIIYDVTAFSNLTQDHLDFFGDMETYGAAKAKLFTPQLTKLAILNADDEFGQRLINKSLVDTITYGCLHPSDVFGINLKMSVGGLEYTLNLLDNVTKIKCNMTGRFNMYNTMCAATIAGAIGVPLKKIAEGIRKFKRVEGRYNIINTTKCSIIIDFAHTDEGLKNIITSIREYVKGKIITVFGCGGDRDKKKRPLMGRVCALMSDFCVLTSDNPRSEVPMDIIKDIAKGIDELGLKNYTTMSERTEAIKYALNIANEDDIVLIAGKGAEKYQEIHGVKYPYNDSEYVMKLIEENRM